MSDNNDDIFDGIDLDNPSNKDKKENINDTDFSEELEFNKKSKRRTKKDAEIVPELLEDSKIQTVPMEKVLHDSMLPYSEYVIMDRALPRVEDGLKPVQRRVLFSMLEVGVLPDRPYRKSARIVGDCMGKYHPHGDKSIYDTMVRMAQDFNMNEVLVAGHGNYGSVDGDCAAAMRYTEARLAPLSLELLRDIEKDTVTWSYNFDDSCKEPDMLPGRFPNLLVNGSMGIAVGLSTNIPTHNLRETCNAVCAYIDNKNISLTELLQIMPGPDFPTGAYILKESEIRELYKTGKGKIYIRSKIHIENAENGKKNIVITEIPYQVNKANLLQRIANLRDADEGGYLSYIAEILDESDRHGTRAVIKLKKDAKVGNILALLYKNSDLQSTFNANVVAIADGKPKQLSLIEILDYYVNYQQKIVYNRTKFDLETCLKKEHILEGLLIAINNIDEVVRIIKTSKNVTEAKITLMQRFVLSEVQAQAILDMRLSRLTSLEVNKLISELNRLKDLIKRYTAILKSPALQMKIVKQELQEIAKTYGRDRRTEFVSPNEELIEEDTSSETEDINEELNIVITPNRTIKAISQKSYNLATKEIGANSSVYEIPNLAIKVNRNKKIYLFTNIGNCIKVDVNKIEICKFRDRGANLSAHYKNLEDNEVVVSVLTFDETNSKDNLIFFTKMGMIKISIIEEYFASKQCIGAIKLKDDDELINVEICNNTDKCGIFTRNGIGSIVPINDISSSGRMSVGIKGIALSDNDYVVNAMQVTSKDNIAIFGNNGMFKTLKYVSIPQCLRNKKGTKILPTKITNKLCKAVIFDKNLNFVLETQVNQLIYVSNDQVVIDNIDTVGKYAKNIRADNIIKNVYNHITT